MNFQAMTIEADGTLKGPGVLDMKGGLIVLSYALKALHHHGRLEESNITVFLNTDEEVGSLGSRSILEKQAGRHDVGLIFEGTHGHKLTRERKGLGQARIKVTGRESHAGAFHEGGVSANLELAHKVIDLEALTDYRKGTTVNVGTMQGGEKRNTRPGCAEAFVDLRYIENRDGVNLKAQVERIALHTYTHYKKFPRASKIRGVGESASTCQSNPSGHGSINRGCHGPVRGDWRGDCRDVSVRWRNGWFPDSGQRAAHGG